MSEAAIFAIIAGHDLVIISLAGWLFLHERRCADRWARHMEEYGKAVATQEYLEQDVRTLKARRR